MCGVFAIIGGVKRFHRLFLFFAAAVLACGPAGADTLRIADVPWLGRAALDGSNPYVVTGLVTFVMSWLPGSIILTDPGDPDGPAVYMTDRLYGPILAQGLEDLRPGDLLEMTANPVAMQLEPGLYVSRVSEYAFRVLAVNSIGRGPPSTLGSVLEPTAQLRVDGYDIRLSSAISTSKLPPT